MKYLTPALISITIFTILPILYTIYISFTNYTIYSNGKIDFVGLSNFINVFTGPFKEVFIPVFVWTVLFAVISTIGCFSVGLGFAMILNNPNLKERGFYKGLLIIPWALPVTIAVISWQGLLNGSYGAINTLLLNINLIQEPIKFLSDPNFARVCIILVNIWLGFPYMMNVCSGALAAIPKTYYEAADMDGASKFQQFRKITLPSIAVTSFPLLITTFAFNFNNFNSAYLITSGGPAQVGTQFAGYTDILASTTYKLSTQFGRYDMASALSIILFVIVATLAYIQMKASRQFEEVK